MPQPCLKHAGSVAKKKTKFAKITLKKIYHTKTVGDRGILITYLNSSWKNTWETRISFHMK